MQYKNDGNVHVKPIGTVTINNIFGRKVAQLALDPRNVFPGGERRITVLWPQKRLWGIYYHAQVTAIYGDKHQTMTAETNFWAFPLWAAIVLGILLLFLILARKRLLKVVKVLIKG